MLNTESVLAQYREHLRHNRGIYSGKWFMELKEERRNSLRYGEMHFLIYLTFNSFHSGFKGSRLLYVVTH